MPSGGERAPRASFSRNTSLDSSVICTHIQYIGCQIKTSTAVAKNEPAVSHLAVLLFYQPLGLLDVSVELLDVAGLGL